MIVDLIDSKLTTGNLHSHNVLFCRELLHHGRRAGQEEMTEIQVVSGKTNLIVHIETYQL